MSEGGIRNGSLLAAAHIQGVDTLEMSKGGTSYGSLLASFHLQGVDAIEMSKGCIRQLPAV